MNHYYYDRLNKEEQKTYYAMKEGLLSLQDEIQVPILDKKSLSDIFFMIRMDHPEIFYSVTFSYKYYENSNFVTLCPVYLFEKKKMKDHIQAMDSRIKKIVRQAERLSEQEKEKFIHDFIVENVKYDKLKKEYSHEIIGALGNGIAVCEGIAKTVKVLCDHLKIWCIVVISENNPEKKIKYRHAWNIVRINGSYYHLDATFDNSLSRDGVVRYDYFNLADNQIFRDHEPVIWPGPVCSDHDHFYYREKKQSWTTLEEVRNRTSQAVRKRKPLLFHWRGGYLTKEVFRDILLIFQEEAAKKGLHSYIAVNWPQAVIRAQFREEAGSEAVEMEEANEGEQDLL